MMAQPAMGRRKGLALLRRGAMAVPGVLLWAALDVAAEPLRAAQPVALPASLPNAGASILRICGAFLVVVAVFLAGAWLFRNWQRLAVKKNGGAKLHLLEVKSLGQRQALYVVAYQEQRMLLASSPAGVTLLSHLPSAEEGLETPAAPNVSFADALKHVLSQRQ
jgi:flagellar biogenesis protein FliO